MKKPNWKIALFLVWSTGWLQAQEVTTNDEGRKIVVEANGQWHYFQENNALRDSSFLPPKIIAQANEQRIVACQEREKEISLSLITARLELIELQVAMQNGSGAPSSRQREQLAQKEQQIRSLELLLEETSARKVFLQEIANLPLATYERRLKKWEEDHPPSSQNLAPNLEQKPIALNTAILEIANGILVSSPRIPCGSGAETTDKQRGETQWETAPTLFFSHTDQTVEQQFQKRDFISCTGHLTAMQGGKKYLNLEMAVATVNAPEIFGKMPMDEYLEIQLLNGETLRLFNKMPNNGQWSAPKDAFVYFGRYALGIKEEKMLRDNEVDLVMVRWSQVQDKYAVFQTDFFMRQFECLDTLFSEEN